MSTNNKPTTLDYGVIELYNQEKSIKYIAKLYKSSGKTVKNFLIDNNVNIRNYRTPRSDMWNPCKKMAKK